MEDLVRGKKITKELSKREFSKLFTDNEIKHELMQGDDKNLYFMVDDKGFVVLGLDPYNQVFLVSSDIRECMEEGDRVYYPIANTIFVVHSMVNDDEGNVIIWLKLLDTASQLAEQLTKEE